MATETQPTLNLQSFVKDLLLNCSLWVFTLPCMSEWIEMAVSASPAIASVLQYRDDPFKLKAALALSIESDFGFLLVHATTYLMPYLDFWNTLLERLNILNYKTEEIEVDHTLESILTKTKMMDAYMNTFPLTVKIALEPLMTVQLTTWNWIRLFRYIRVFAQAARDLNTTQ